MIKKSDYVLIITLFIISVTLFFMLFKTNNYSASFALVFINGNMYEKVALPENKLLVINTAGINMEIKVMEYSVSVLYSNCQDKHCIRQSFIQNINQSIVCLPNRAIVTIEGGTGDIDAFVR